MPQHIALPIGAGDLSEWTVTGAATAHEATADELNSTYLQTVLAGKRVRVAFGPLPVDAATVSRVSLVFLAAGDSVGTLRPVTRLGGVDDTSASPVMPPEGGFSAYVHSFDLAPDGGAWTVAKRNALQAGVDSVLAVADPGIPLFADTFRLATDYETATSSEAPPEPVASVRFPDTRAVDVPLPGSAQVAFPDPAEAPVAFPGDAEVTFPDPATAEIPVTPKSG